jgi:hypothetical protein
MKIQLPGIRPDTGYKNSRIPDTKADKYSNENTANLKKNHINSEGFNLIFFGKCEAFDDNKMISSNRQVCFPSLILK